MAGFNVKVVSPGPIRMIGSFCSQWSKRATVYKKTRIPLWWTEYHRPRRHKVDLMVDRRQAQFRRWDHNSRPARAAQNPGRRERLGAGKGCREGERGVARSREPEEYPCLLKGFPFHPFLSTDLQKFLEPVKLFNLTVKFRSPKDFLDHFLHPESFWKNLTNFEMPPTGGSGAEPGLGVPSSLNLKVKVKVFFTGSTHVQTQVQPEVEPQVQLGVVGSWPSLRRA